MGLTSAAESNPQAQLNVNRMAVAFTRRFSNNQKESEAQCKSRQWKAANSTSELRTNRKSLNNCLCVGRRLFTLSAAVVQIDATRFFIAEEFTPLFHTPAYAVLPHKVRLRYNQLHGFYFNEQVTFFEQEMLSPALRALARAKLPQLLVEGVREFYRDEQRHTASFRALNRQCAPEFYAHRDYFFVGISPASRAVVRTIS